jgi:dipeptidyl aminopeptidase/acylaminoacyl peptidase
MNILPWQTFPSPTMTIRKLFLPLCLLAAWLGAGPALAQTPKPAPKPITWKEVASWKAIPFFGTQLAPDGQWLAYVLSPNEGDAELVLRKTTDTTQHRYPIGAATFAQMSFSDDSRWIAFKVYPKDRERKAAAKTPGKPLPEKVFLVELATNKKTEFDRVRSFAFNGELATHLAVLLAPAGTPTPDGPRGSDLLLHDLKTGKTQNLGNVAEMALNKRGDWLALAIDAADKAGNGLQLRNLATGATLVLDSDKATYRAFNWTEKGDGLALVKGQKDEKFKNERFQVLGVRNFGGLPQLVSYDPKADSARFPKGLTISPNRPPQWTEDLGRLLFGIHKLEPAKKDSPAGLAKKDDKPAPGPAASEAERLAKIRADTSIKNLDDLAKALAKAKPDSSKKAPAMAPAAKDEPEKPEVTIWHWQDPRLQSRQQVQENSDKNFSFLAMYDVAAQAFTRLADSTLRTLQPMPKHLYALGNEGTAYELERNLDGQIYTDVYVVDLKTGQRQKVLEKHYQASFWGSPDPSPDGTKLAYARDGHYWVYDLLTKTHRNLTEKAPTSFVDTDEDTNVKLPTTPRVGWTADSRYLLLRDRWDLWKISVDGKETVNLSRHGQRDRIRYQGRALFYPDEKGIDLKLPQYFRVYGERTKKSGLARLDNGQQMTTVLWEDANLGSLIKAKKADLLMFSRETFATPANYYAASAANLAQAKPLTQNAPDHPKYAWSPGARLVDYVSDKGDSLQGALFLPAGYEPGKKYPTIVYYYEKLSQTLHNFSNPGFSGTGWNPGVYTSNGYAVFVPDIVYKHNDPGMSAFWCVLPGVRAALQTGVIDEQRMGLHGHSWGGYQTSFLITQTNQFKAAAAGAPLTDLVSMYNLIYWNSGNSNGSIFEASQGRMVPPWDNWEAYQRNSPMHHVKQVNTPLLMLHNDKDGAVDFTQGVEFYNALRRLRKPVVMVQYKGENHGLAKLPNRKDYAVRMMEFFDHHLKGKPAPAWLARGVPKLELDEHLDRVVFEEE